jgi:pimeloyl-ACP methyl ester carboxylesterase
VENLGYERGKDFFEYSYDWRQDVRRSAFQLGAYIDSLGLSQPVIIVAHSMGTIVSRYYIERLGGRKKVERAILMGGPHRGVPKALVSLIAVPGGLPFGLMGERIRQVISTFPSCYQILPTYACASDQHGNQINFLEDETWLTEAQVALHGVSFAGAHCRASCHIDFRLWLEDPPRLVFVQGAGGQDEGFCLQE